MQLASHVSLTPEGQAGPGGAWPELGLLQLLLLLLVEVSGTYMWSESCFRCACCSASFFLSSRSFSFSRWRMA